MQEIVTITMPLWLVWVFITITTLSLVFSILTTYYKRRILKVEEYIKDRVIEIAEDKPNKKAKKNG